MRATFTSLAAAAAATALLAVTAQTAMAQKSYPLMCNGGAPMQATATASGDLTLRFRPGDRGASTSPPASGHCSWLDRGWRQGEPTTLRVDNNSRWAKYLVDNMLTGRTFYAHVYNDRSGNMVVTRIGP